MMLALSLLPLFLAPLLVRLLKSLPFAAQALDSFVLVAVGGLVLLHILPHAFAQAGGVAFAAAVLGLLIPFGAERLLGRAVGGRFSLFFVPALSFLAVHGMLDGVALAAPEAGVERGHVLAAAVLLHRLPAALAVWWLLEPRFGAGPAALTLSILLVGTVLGYGLAVGGFPELFELPVWQVVQALLAGSLIHVILHQSQGAAAPSARHRWHWASLLGIAGAVALLAALSAGAWGHADHGDHHHHEEGAPELLVELALMVAPAVVAGFVLAFLYHLLTGSSSPGGRRSRSSGPVRTLAELVAVGVCTCNIESLYLRLRRFPALAAALVVAAPEMGIGVLLLTATLMGGEMALLRLGFAVLMAGAAALALGRRGALGQRAGDHAGCDHGHDAVAAQDVGHGADEGCEAPAGGGWSSRVVGALKLGFLEAPAATLPWLLAGLLLAAMISSGLDGQALPLAAGWTQRVVVVIVAIVVYVCSIGSTPLVAVLLAAGLGPGSALAFMLVGGATSNRALRRIRADHGRGGVVRFVSALALVGLAVAALGDRMAGSGGLLAELAPLSLPEPLPVLALGLLALLVLLAIGLKGAAGFFGTLLTLHGHVHGSGHPGHDGHSH